MNSIIARAFIWLVRKGLAVPISLVSSPGKKEEQVNFNKLIGQK